ncbi:MAG: hypothetical protein ACYCTW_12600 [Sulfuricella sp.]
MNKPLFETHSLVETPALVEILEADSSYLGESGPRETARQAFRDAERRLGVAGRAIVEHLDKRVDAGFADVLKQAADLGLKLDEQDKVDILNRRDVAKADFATRQSALHERLTTAFQHLALNDIAGVKEALDRSADAMSPLPASGSGNR